MPALLLAGVDHWDGPPWWPVFPLLWLVAIGGVIAFFVLRNRPYHRRAEPYAAHARLAERYAAGEITEQEYRERRSVLQDVEDEDLR